MKTTSQRANAKINLVLAVGPPLPPKGYHPIVSWFACVDLFDTIKLERLNDGEKSEYAIEWAEDVPRATPIDWPVEKDLGVRAHRLMEELVGRALSVRMRVTKRVPVGGGLGGGSADAAAVMRGVRRLFALDVSVERMRAASTRLGSDVAFFLDDDGVSDIARPAVVSGIGEVIERVASVKEGTRVVLIFPPFGCPTAAVYAAFDERANLSAAQHEFAEAPTRVHGLVNEAAAHGVSAVVDRVWNDLAGPACKVEPRLGEMLGRLRSTGLMAHVTGSGSTMFVVVDKGDERERVLAVLGADAAVIETAIV